MLMKMFESKRPSCRSNDCPTSRAEFLNAPVMISEESARTILLDDVLYNCANRVRSGSSVETLTIRSNPARAIARIVRPRNAGNRSAVFLFAREAELREQIKFKAGSTEIESDRSVPAASH